MRLLTLAAIVVAALTFTGGTASAGGLTRCGGGNGRQGGPVRNLTGGVAHRVQVRQAARGCQPAVAFPAPAAVAGVPVTAGSCNGGACSAVR
jgi:hypothetical protein